MGTGQLLAMGLKGIADAARKNAGSASDEVRARNLLSISRSYDRVRTYVEKHAALARTTAAAGDEQARERLMTVASNCDALAAGPPSTFHQAIQLLWFALPLRNRAGSSTLGRLDQHLYPFYRRDVDRGLLTEEFAQALVDELMTKIDRIWTGDGLMTLAVAGLRPDGTDATNDVSYMLMDAKQRLRLTNPQINVRLHARSSDAFRRRTAEMQVSRTGQCTVLNDEAIVPALIASGEPEDLARNYCCDGCNELIYDGESTIAFLIVEAVKCLELTLFNGEDCPVPEGTELRANYLLAREGNRAVSSAAVRGHRSGDFARMTTFEQVFEAFMDQYTRQLDELVECLCRTSRHQVAEMASPPFLSGTFPECLRTGADLLRGGVRRQVFMLFSGSLPTVADGLAAIKKVVFEDRAATPEELLEALRAGWVGHDALRHECMAAPKFGNDDPAVDAIAARLVDRFADHIASRKHDLPGPLHPALFCNEFNRFAMLAAATPDGRRRGEPIAEHFSPVPGRARRGPTAVINSMARSDLSRMTGVAVSHISLSRTALGTDAEAADIVLGLTAAALKMGLLVVNFPVYDVEQLRLAQQDPERYADLLVRVWGFSERFVTLDRRVQDHIIARAVSG
jgi:formate C-acetyltransferase